MCAPFQPLCLYTQKPPTYAGGFNTSRWVSLTPHLNPISSCVEATNFLPREVLMAILPKLLITGKAFIKNYNSHLYSAIIDTIENSF